MNIASLQKVIGAVAEFESLGAVLQSVVRGLAEQPDMALTRIWLAGAGDICSDCYMRRACQDQTRCLHLAASAGNPLDASEQPWTSVAGHFRRIPLEAQITKVAHIGATGEPVLIQIEQGAGKQRWIARPEWMREQQIRSFAGQPLVVEGQVMGVLAVFSRAPLGERDLTSLRAFADQAAVAIALARTADHLRILLEMNNTVVATTSPEALLHSIAESLRRGVQFDWAALALHVPERGLFRLLAAEGHRKLEYFQPGRELDCRESSAGWVFENQRPILRADLQQEHEYANERWLAAEGLCSQCIVPLIIRGTCIGVLAVASEKKNLYGEADAGFLQEVANQIALAVENIKAYQEVKTLQERLEKENTYLQEEIRTEHGFDEIIGHSPCLLKLLRQVEQVAPTTSNVLIYGETGTGKELIARAIHDRSPRANRPLVKVNCGSIPAGLVESELFGHVKGAFTGAMSNRTGRFELADEGTIFLDEIGELPLDTQVKLLRVLQEREFEPVGSSRTVRVDVRIIAATNRDLEEAVRTGRFRSDLFYRLNVLPLHVPALRERRGDIPQLVLFFLNRYAKKEARKIERVTPETMEILANYAWPGNIRELQNVVERGVVLSRGPALILGRDLLPLENTEPGGDREFDIAEGDGMGVCSLEEVEKRHIAFVLERTGGMIAGPKGAASVLKLHPNTLRSRMQRLGLKWPGHDIS